MLLRISLILAIIAGLAAGGLAYVAVSDKIPALQKQRDDEHTAKVNEIAAHGKTKTELKKTQAELATTKQDLSDTKADLAKSNDRADKQQKRADDLSDKLVKVTSERDTAQNDLAAYKATELTPDQVFKLSKDLKNAHAEIDVVNGEKTVLLHKVAKLQIRLDKYEGTNSFIVLRPDLRGKVVVVDPKWDFVVLDVGEDQGVISDGEMLVSRSGKLVAKIVVRTVQKDRCIANLVPGWKLGPVIEGDEVSPAHPAT
jgi:hypothetical protein